MARIDLAIGRRASYSINEAPSNTAAGNAVLKVDLSMWLIGATLVPQSGADSAGYNRNQPEVIWL